MKASCLCAGVSSPESVWGVADRPFGRLGGRGRDEPPELLPRTAYRPLAAWYRRLNRLGVLLTSLGLALETR